MQYAVGVISNGLILNSFVFDLIGLPVTTTTSPRLRCGITAL